MTYIKLMFSVEWKNKAIKQLTKIGSVDTRREIKNAVATLVDLPNVR